MYFIDLLLKWYIISKSIFITDPRSYRNTVKICKHLWEKFVMINQYDSFTHWAKSRYRTFDGDGDGQPQMHRTYSSLLLPTHMGPLLFLPLYSSWQSAGLSVAAALKRSKKSEKLINTKTPNDLKFNSLRTFCWDKTLRTVITFYFYFSFTL